MLSNIVAASDDSEASKRMIDSSARHHTAEGHSLADYARKRMHRRRMVTALLYSQQTKGGVS